MFDKDSGGPSRGKSGRKTRDKEDISNEFSKRIRGRLSERIPAEFYRGIYLALSEGIEKKNTKQLIN